MHQEKARPAQSSLYRAKPGALVRLISSHAEGRRL
jgi:hypothetical protein